MLGGIYARGKCPKCNANTFVNNEKREGFFCKNHSDIRAQRLFVKFKGIFKSFPARDYLKAVQFLHGLRHETTQGKFDENNYKKNSPVAVPKLVDEYLKYKYKTKDIKAPQKIEAIMQHFESHFKNISVKSIDEQAIEEYLFGLPVASKTRKNYLTQVRNFFKFVSKRRRKIVGEDFRAPEMPEIEVTMEKRKTVSREDQQKLIQKVNERFSHNEKLAVALDLLSNHPAMRPDDISRIKEGNINLKEGTITIISPTKRSRNTELEINLLPDQIEMIAVLKTRFPAHPDMPFFRHPPNVKGVKADTPFGKQYISKKIKTVLLENGVTDVVPYALLKHSTLTHINKHLGKKMAKAASLHRTNSALMRYIDDVQTENEVVINFLDETRGKSSDVGRVTTLPKRAGQ